eukprot:TRINITY_DN30370_c0_g1_i1.p1 TRINITY_DN30370_c0_g1~~TRINITY_DN30370_c0_g1_i1.p1  ORF type:complete len:708 (+),score=89.06 TRINITY_DN30370_c0_g1_i1:1829-3952(+)
MDFGVGAGTLPMRAEALRDRHDQAKLEYGKGHTRKVDVFFTKDKHVTREMYDSVKKYNGLYVETGSENGKPRFVHPNGDSCIHFINNRWTLTLDDNVHLLAYSDPRRKHSCKIFGKVAPNWAHPEHRTKGHLRCYVSVREKSFLSSHFFKVFQLLLSMKDIPEQVFVFSAMNFNAAVNDDGHDQGVVRDDSGKKAPVFEAAEDLFARAGRTMPKIVFWNLSGCNEGVPTVATQPGALLVSGFSPALVSDILSHGSPDPLALISDVISSSLFKNLAVAPTATEAESLIRTCLALEGYNASEAEAKPKAFAFPKAEDWHVVEAVPVEATAVEALAPKRAPLLSVRGVRRTLELGDAETTEMALLDLIGPRGRRVKEARSVLSAAASSSLKLRARVWLDVEYVEERLGAIAVTVSARCAEKALRELLGQLLLPAVDALVARVRVTPEELATRQQEWISGEWNKRMQQTSYGEKRIVNDVGEMPYKEEQEQMRQLQLQKAKSHNFKDEDVVAALLEGIDVDGRAVVRDVLLKRREWPEFAAPRYAYNPCPRESDSAAASAMASLARARQIQCKAQYDRALMRRLAHCPSGRTTMGGKAILVGNIDDESDMYTSSTRVLRQSHLPRSGPHGTPAIKSRKFAKSHHLDVEGRNARMSSQNESDERSDRSQSPSRVRAQAPLKAKRDEKAQLSANVRKRQQMKQLARDAKFYDR